MEKTGRLSRKLLILMGVLFACTIGLSVKVHAYGIQQSSIQATSIPVSWTKPNDKVLSYTVSAGDDYNSLQKIATLPATATSYSVPAPAGSKKYIKVEYTYQGYSSQYTSTVGSLSGGVTLPTKVTGVNQQRWWRFALNSDVGWNQVPSATGYKLTFRNSKNKVMKEETTRYNSKTPSSTLTKVKNNMIYTVVVQAYTTFNGKTYWGDPSEKAYLFTSPEVTSSKVKGGKLKVNWKPVAGATGYDIYVSDKKKNDTFKKAKSVSGKTTLTTIDKISKKKKFKSGKTYYYYVLSKRKKGGEVVRSAKSFKLFKVKM